MTIVFNGITNSINLGGAVFSGNASGLTDAPAGTIIQTVIGTNEVVNPVTTSESEVVDKSELRLIV